MKVCGCKGCDLPVLAMGMCNKHWRRNKLYGSPFVIARQTAMFKGLPAKERFNRQYKINGECWEWSSAIDRDGYGRFSAELHGVSYQKAHRYSWALHNGKQVPDGMSVCHSCDNRKCVNPAHLWIGTNEENMLDKIAKGRHRNLRGEDHPDSILTEIQVLSILADARPHTVLAQEYGVHAQTISSIKTRKSWAHLDVENVAKAPRVSHRKGKSDKLNDGIVREILRGDVPGSEWAERLGVSRQLITNIRKRRVWKHVN